MDGWERVREQHGDGWGTDPGLTWEPNVPHTYTNHVGIRTYLRNVRNRRLENEWMAGKTTEVALDWLGRNAARQDFCLCIDMWDPHETFDASPRPGALGRLAN